MPTPLSESSPTQRSLRWVQDAGPRFTRILPSEWKQHRAAICEHYQRLDLDEVMASMRELHDFTPNRRQYVYQLQKWNVFKYKTAKANRIQGQALTERSFSGRGALTPEASTTSNSPPHTKVKELPKRRSSVQSDSPSMSATHQPATPEEYRSDPDMPVNDGIDCTDTNTRPDAMAHTLRGQNFSSVGGENASLRGQSFESPSHGLSSSYAGDPGKMLVDTPSTDRLIFSGSELGRLSSLTSTSIDPVTTDQRDNSNKSSTSRYRYYIRRKNPSSQEVTKLSNDVTGPSLWAHWNSVESLSLSSKTTTADRSLDSWSPIHIFDMELAGGYWEAVGWNDKAFSIYANLLPCDDRPIYRHAVISCARCVSTPAHCEITQSHLRAEEKRVMSDQNVPSLDQFMICMALSETCSRVSDMDGAKLHLLRARDLIKQFACVTDIFQRLPNGQDGFDLSWYLYLRRAYYPEEDLLPGVQLDASASLRNQALGLDLLDLQVLHNVLGSPLRMCLLRKMEYSWLTSCLEWCRQSLPSGVKIWPPHEDISRSRSRLKKRQMWLFDWLTVRYQCLVELGLTQWGLEASRRTGLSPIEVIAIVCVQVDAEWGPSDNSHDGLISRLLLQTDSQLVSQFLDAFLAYRSITPGRISG